MEVETIDYVHLPFFINGSKKKRKFWIEHGDIEVNPHCETTFEQHNNLIVKGTQKPRLKGDFWEGRDHIKNILTTSYHISNTNKGAIMTFCAGYLMPAEYKILPPKDSKIVKIVHAKSSIYKKEDSFNEEPNEKVLRDLEKASLETHLREIQGISLSEITLEEAKEILENLYEKTPYNKYDFWTV